MKLKWKINSSLFLSVFLVSIVFFPSITSTGSSSSISSAGPSSSVSSTGSSSLYDEPKAESVAYTPVELRAIEMAKKVFEQNHTEPVYEFTIFREDETASVFVMGFYYIVTFNCSQGQFDITYRRDYRVYVEVERVEDGPIDTDVPEGFVIRFIGKDPVTSKEQATYTFFLLLQKSPSRNYYIFSVDNDRLSLEASEAGDYYDVVGVFRNFAVNCLNAKIVIEYNIFHNGTAILQGATTVVDCLEPPYT